MSFVIPLWAAAGLIHLFRRVSIAVLAFLLGSAAVLCASLFPDMFPKQAIALCATALLFLFIFFLRNHAVKPVVLVSSLAFLIFLALVFVLLALHLFSHYSPWVIIPSVYIVAFLLMFFSNSAVLDLGFWLKFRLVLFSSVAALLLAEWYWIASSLPLRIIDIDFLVGIVYYTLWDIVHRYFSLQFTKRSLLVACLAMCVALLVVCASAQWLP